MAKSGIEARRKAALEEGGGVYIARREEMRSILDKGRCDGTLRADLPLFFNELQSRNWPRQAGFAPTRNTPAP